MECVSDDQLKMTDHVIWVWPIKYDRLDLEYDLPVEYNQQRIKK